MTYVGANLSITAHPIAVTADAKSKIYGDSDPALTYQVTSGELVNGDGFNGGLTRVVGENAGDYAIQQGTLTAGSNYALSFVGANLTITPATTTTILVSSADPSILGQAVTYTATVTADAPSTGTPSGTVQFQVDGSDYGNPATLAENNTASLTLSTLAAGAHTIVAVYTPAGSNFLASTSSVCPEQVNEVNSQNLANVIEQMMTANPGQPITIDIQTLDNTAAQGQVAAIDALGPQNTPITFQLGLSSGGNYQSLHASPPQNVTLVITGTLGQSGNTYTTIIVGHSPALTVGLAKRVGGDGDRQGLAPDHCYRGSHCPGHRRPPDVE